MTAIVVQKYGGSSVADTARIKQVAARIAATREQGKQVVVVVSAMGKTTDDLLQRAREIAPSPSRRELDMLLTCGERASMALLSMAVQEHGYEAISLTGSQSGIITNHRHSGARIMDVRPFRVQDELHAGRVVIVAGFQGVSYKREITTLGRGGSDTTAVALAAALGAEYCEICSDVEGVYTADPRIVSAARLLEAISQDEMLELAAHGARVLHAQAVEFAQRSRIALYARATASSGPGTRIDHVGNEDRASAGVTGKQPLVRLRANRTADALHALSSASVPLLHVGGTRPSVDADRSLSEPGQWAADLWFALDDVPDWPTVRATLADTCGANAITENLGAVTAVGLGLGEDPIVLERVYVAIAELGATVHAIDASPLRITVFCDRDDVERLLVELHRKLCE